MVLSNLPLEIISEILTRLPVKSLLRFRCVSKSWLSLIESPYLIKSHLNSSSIHINKCTSHRMTLTCVYDWPITIYSCLLDSAMHQLSTVKATLIDSPCSGIRNVISLVGSCNGLICISIFCDCVVLWNSSIRQSRKLPNPAVPLPSYCWIHGFGYDELNDDYKLVEILSDNISGLGACGGDKPVNVYSLRTNSWRSIKVGDLLLPPWPAKFANGALYWLVLVEKRGLKVSCSISSFDLANETFQTIDLSNISKHFIDTDAICNLGVLGGCLCLCCDYFYKYKLDLWILENNGVKESWTKLVSIRYSRDAEGPISPLFISENGEILLIHGSQFMLYNIKDKTSYFPNIPMGCRSLRRCDEVTACVYIESLVSPNTGGEGWSSDQ